MATLAVNPVIHGLLITEFFFCNKPEPYQRYPTVVDSSEYYVATVATEDYHIEPRKSTHVCKHHYHCIAKIKVNFKYIACYYNTYR